MKIGKIIQISTVNIPSTNEYQGNVEITALDDKGNIWSRCLFPKGDVWGLLDMTTEFNRN